MCLMSIWWSGCALILSLSFSLSLYIYTVVEKVQTHSIIYATMASRMYQNTNH